MKFGSELGKALGEIVTIVAPDTLRRWIRESKKPGGIKRAKRGRPRTKEEIRELIIKFARENDWGYTRIMGELKKLGVKPPSRNTVKNILKENGLDPGPKRGAGTWDEFLKMHAASLWQCDFYSKKVLTLKGFRDLYLLIFLHVDSRRVYISPSTFHPDEGWVNEQANAFLEHSKETGLAATRAANISLDSFWPCALTQPIASGTPSGPQPPAATLRSYTGTCVENRADSSTSGSGRSIELAASPDVVPPR